MTIGKWLSGVSQVIPRLEAEVLAAHVVGVSRSELLAHPEWEAPAAALAHVFERRFSGEPIAYITSKKEFYGREFYVDKSVLIPRPETETLVETALQCLPDNAICLDLGTGSGVIALTLALENPKTKWIASDISRSALRVAQINAKRLDADVSFILADAMSAFASECFDVIVSNPPYISNDDTRLEDSVRKWEPPEALFAERGFAFIDNLLIQSPKVLRRGGVLLFEFGEGQENHVIEKAPNASIIKDLSGKPRVAFHKVTNGRIS